MPLKDEFVRNVRTPVFTLTPAALAHAGFESTTGLPETFETIEQIVQQVTGNE